MPRGVRKARVEHVVRETRRLGERKAPPGAVGRLTRDLLLPLFLKRGVATFAPIYAHHIPWEDRVAA